MSEHVISKGITSIINTEGKGNAWWLYNSIFNYINEPLCVFTCDNIIDTDYEKLLNDYISLKKPYCRLVPTNPINGREGDYIFADQNKDVKKLSRVDKSNI